MSLNKQLIFPILQLGKGPTRNPNIKIIDKIINVREFQDSFANVEH